jgi:hypothetical protein
MSILRLNQKESIRHSLYNIWRRKRQKIQRDLSENRPDSVEKSDKSDKESKDRYSSSNNSQTSDMSISHRETRSTVQGQSKSLTLIEASFIFTSKEWKEIYNSSKRKMESDWVNVIYKKVCSCNFHCTLVFQRHCIGVLKIHIKRILRFFVV